VLEDVRELVEDEAIAPSRLPALAKLLDNPDGLPRCISELESLKMKLEPKGRHADRMQALIWPLKEGEVKKTLEYLGQFQHSLSTTLTVDQTYVHIVDIRPILIVQADV